MKLLANLAGLAAALLLASPALAVNVTLKWNPAEVSTLCQSVAKQNNFTWTEQSYLMYQGTDANGASPGALGGTFARVNNSDGSYVYDTQPLESAIALSKIEFSGCCAFDEFTNGGPKYRCAGGSVFKVDPSSVALGSATATTTSGAAATTEAAASTSSAAVATSTLAPAASTSSAASASTSTAAAASSTSAAPVSTTSKPSSADRMGRGLTGKAAAIAGAAAAVFAIIV